MALTDLGIAHLPLFILAGLLLNLTPGPDVFYIVTNALRSGLRAGVVAALGITVGCFVHVFAAALGVSALLAASATAFTVLKWAGAAYLLWMGAKLLFSKTSQDAKVLSQGEKAGSLRAVFLGGFWTNVLNPKVAIFFLAFVPQFIAPQAEHKALAFLLLGVLFEFNGMWVNMGWALVAAWMMRHVRVMQYGMKWLDRVAGAMFIGFGLKLALSQNPSHS